MATLEFIREGKSLFSYPVQGTKLTVGRSSDCDVVLNDPTISRKHFTLYYLDHQYFVKALDKNMLQVQGQELQSMRLSDQNKFSISSWDVIFHEENLEDEQAETLVASLNQSHSEIASRISGSEVCSSEFILKINQSGKELGQKLIEKEISTVGSQGRNEIVIEDERIRGKHLKLVKSDLGLELVDLTGRKGLSCDGKFANSFYLQSNQEVQFLDYSFLCEEVLQNTETAIVELDQFYGLIGQSAQMKKLYSMIARLGISDAPVIILGESGSGKELVAQAIHKASPRKSRRFVSVNCGAISKELIESELFGHEKGAFTGAQAKREGLFEYAQDGTLFLDEIGELPLDLQPKLLRVLENHTYKRVGGNQDLPSRCRIVAATHRDLAQMVREGKFREDLFFRLFVLPIFIPALRDRVEDIPVLATFFMKEFSKNGQRKTLSEKALLRLKQEKWPGNVRELKNLLQRSFVLSAKSDLDPDDLEFVEHITQRPVDALEALSAKTIDEMEREMMISALKRHSGNKQRAAEELGIPRSTFFKKVKLHNLDQIL